MNACTNQSNLLQKGSFGFGRKARSSKNLNEAKIWIPKKVKTPCNDKFVGKVAKSEKSTFLISWTMGYIGKETRKEVRVF